MLAGIGVDIAETARFERLQQRFGDRIARRILTGREFERYLERHRSATYLASRFAAKEAASKALGTGIARGIGFHDIEVSNNEDGKPELHFHRQAAELIRQRGIRQSLLSLSDEKHYAVAMVVLETAG
jgi:holo-[acyl-carrier protein] synthase